MFIFQEGHELNDHFSGSDSDSILCVYLSALDPGQINIEENHTVLITIAL